jgi:hypothetical protein
LRPPSGGRKSFEASLADVSDRSISDRWLAGQETFALMAVTPDRRDDMNCGGRARYALAIGWLVAPLAGAAAGEPGPISKGTVSISITIPPHVLVRASAEGDPADLPDPCIGGLRDYRLAILDPAGSPREGAIPPGRPGECLSLSAAALASHVADSGAHGPLTLLIIPN